MTRSNPRRSKAFTLLEVLIVVAIIVILATMTVLGLKYLNPAGKVTKTQMENLRSMMAEYEAAGGSVKALPQGIIRVGGNVTPDGGDYDGDTFPNCWDAADPAFPMTKLTRDAMEALLRVPANKSAFERLGQRMVVVLPKEPPYSTAPPDALLRRAAVDGWSNPIYFVPAAGIQSKLASGNSVTIQAPDGRPFFVSGGADGVISAKGPGPDGNWGTSDDPPAGDDDIYSFQQ